MKRFLFLIVFSFFFLSLIPTAVVLAAELPSTELRYATAFTVETYPDYKEVTVIRPWRDANVQFRYILVQRGQPVPENIGDAQVIEVPVHQMAALAKTHLPYIEALGELDVLSAIGNAQYANSEGVLSRLESGAVQAVGNGPDINLEKLLSLTPEMATTFAMGKSTKDDYQLLMAKGIKTVIFSDYMEESPLGRAEWIKFMALFFNQEEQAEVIFSGIEQRYLALQSLTAQLTDRPKVLMGFEINGKWNMPGGKGYQAAYIRDAGGDYLWADDESTGRIPLTFEAVLEKGADADYWFDQSVSWKTGADLVAADPRNAKILAFAENHVYNNNLRLGPGGGNDYNDLGLVNPDQILADLIAILHPELLPSHEFVFYRHLENNGN